MGGIFSQWSFLHKTEIKILPFEALCLLSILVHNWYRHLSYNTTRNRPKNYNANSSALYTALKWTFDIVVVYVACHVACIDNSISAHGDGDNIVYWNGGVWHRPTLSCRGQWRNFFSSRLNIFITTQQLQMLLRFHTSLLVSSNELIFKWDISLSRVCPNT